MNNLMFGKESFERIVSIEPKNSECIIFYRDENLNLKTIIVPNRYFILSNKYIDGWKKLQGSLHYQYGKTFNNQKDYFSVKSHLKKEQCDIFTVNDHKEAFMIRSGHTYYKGMNPKDLSVLSFDIETTGLEHNDDSKILIISNTYRFKDKLIRKLFTYDEYKSQGEMLSDWCSWVRSVDPDCIIAHNGFSYDLKYMQFICENENIELLLGRNNTPIKFYPYESFKRIDGSRKQGYHKCRIYGREIIDTMFLAINYDIGKRYESFALKKIIAQEGLEVKNRQFYDAANIRNTYMIPEEWVKIKAYAEHDADDSLALFDLMSPAFFYLAQSVPKSFQGIVESASGSQINAMMLRSYLQEGHSIPKASEMIPFEGAISFGNAGIYSNVFKVDVASLYPNIMIQYEVCDKVKDPKGYMLQMVKTFTSERLKNKKLAKETGIKYYDDMQNAQKIVINSFYGFLGAPGLNFNYVEGAAKVTAYGREILNTSINWANENDFDIVNADTDSISFTTGVELNIENRKQLLTELNSLYPERIKFEDDGYFPKVIILAAKNYILYDGKKIKTKGSSLKDAKKEKALKEMQMKIIEAMVYDTNHYKDVYDGYIKEALNITDINRWSSKKTISNKVLTSERANESKVRDAIVGTEIVEGDKAYMYYKPDGSLCLAENFNGEYDKERILEKLFKTVQVFKNVLPNDLFPNYKLKRNKALLEQVTNINE